MPDVCWFASSGRSVSDIAVVNPNFNYSNKSLSTVVESTAIDKLTDNGYKTNKTAFSLGTGFEQFENVFFSPKLSNSYEDLTTSPKASAKLKKQQGTYYESKFSYGLNYDMRNQKFQTTEGFRTQFNQSIALISSDWAFGNSLDWAGGGVVSLTSTSFLELGNQLKILGSHLSALFLFQLIYERIFL